MPATVSPPLFSAVVPAPFGAVGVRAASGVLQELCRRISLRLRRTGLLPAWVEFEQQISGRDLIPFGHQPAHNRFRGFGRQGNAIPFQGPRQAVERLRAAT